jgi:hypothetical protein
LIKRLLILFLFFIYINTFAQISPGELSKAHSLFEGMNNCTKCHELGEKLSNSRCLECHKEINERILVRQGYHSSKYVKGKNCWDCHGEHAGRDFHLIKLDEKNFDHAITGFELSGKHVKLKCKECHQQKNISSSELKRKKKTFLGLSQTCKSCHEDVHQNSLGNNCNNCHNTTSFKPAVFFKHDNAKFKLLGEHIKIECTKCHQKGFKNGREFQKFTGLSFSNCTPCHLDVHKGRLGNDCKKCHVVSGFQFVSRQLFDHNKTDFPLLGKHQAVNCNKCHKGNIGSVPTYNKCINCHKDFHSGQFTFDNIQRDCSECHNIDGFTPSTFTLEQHNQIKFVLEGSHKAIECKACHFKEKTWQFKIGKFNCIDCHSNPHGKEISDKFMQENKCTNCHNTISWRNIEFDHSKTEFELIGKHKEITCGSCHYNEKKSSEKEYHFASLKKDCESCHKDIHYAQFKEDDKTLCERCHTSLNWIPEKFDHQVTKFPLDGVHKKIECRKCHRAISSDGIKYIKFKIEEIKCSSCHS